jgi:hypothetical protein
VLLENTAASTEIGDSGEHRSSKHRLQMTKPTVVNLLEHEFAQERAAALGRLGRKLEAALAAFSHFDAANPRNVSSAEQRRKRAALATEASTALWHFVVQRECCGLRDLRLVLRDYRVPPEIAGAMGALPHPAATGLRKRIRGS